MPRADTTYTMRKTPSNTYAAQLRREQRAPSAPAIATIERTDTGAYAIEARRKGTTLADVRRGAKRASARALRMLETLGALA